MNAHLLSRAPRVVWNVLWSPSPPSSTRPSRGHSRRDLFARPPDPAAGQEYGMDGRGHPRGHRFKRFDARGGRARGAMGMAAPPTARSWSAMQATHGTVFFGGGVGGRLSRNSLAGGRMSTAMDFSFRKCRLRPSLRPGGMIAVRPWLRSSATIPPVFRHETSDLGGVVAASAFQLTPPPRPNAPPCVRVSFWVASTAKPRPPWRADWGVGGWRPGQKRRARKGIRGAQPQEKGEFWWYRAVGRRATQNRRPK